MINPNLLKIRVVFDVAIAITQQGAGAEFTTEPGTCPLVFCGAQEVEEVAVAADFESTHQNAVRREGKADALFFSV